MKGCGALAVLFSLALWLAPSAAFAATTYHAAPAGSGTTCSEAAPCQASVALTLATAGDTVMLAANQGTYGTAGVPLTAALVVPPGVTLTGEPNQAMPIVYSAAGAPDYAGVKFTGAARLADIDVRYTGGGSPSRDRGRSIV